MRFRHGLVPAIHVFVSTVKVVDDRHKAGHDGRVNINGRWYKSGIWMIVGRWRIG
jgi:hypothetical protein